MHRKLEVEAYCNDIPNTSPEYEKCQAAKKYVDDMLKTSNELARKEMDHHAMEKEIMAGNPVGWKFSRKIVGED